MIQQVYILACELGKYYVGITHNIDKRIYAHTTGEGAAWTRLYKPLELIYLSPGNEAKETAMTLIYMRKFGWDNVRGGKYTEINMGAPKVFKFTPEEAELYRYIAIPPKY